MATLCRFHFHLFNQNPPQNARNFTQCRVQATATSTTGESGYGGKAASETRVMVTGSTGYIGRFVVKELVDRGFNVLAVARERSGTGGKWDTQSVAEKELFGADLCLADVTDEKSLRESLSRHLELQKSPNGEGEQGNPSSGSSNIDVVVCCLASRTGGVSDSWKIDYTASRNSLNVGIDLGARHFILLSAICVQKPLLEFQRAKLKLESEIQELPDDISWSIVRPTAFFKSLGGQVEIAKSGGPFVVFGDGNLCACKPISESDLAKFISDCISDTSKHRKVLPIGGPGKAYTPLEQGNLLFGILDKSPRFIKVPIEIMDWSIGLLDWLAKLFPGMADAAEYAKIGRYYAAESMLVLDPVTGKYDPDGTPSYGNDTLEEFFRKVVEEGMAGQELGEQALFLNQKS